MGFGKHHRAWPIHRGKHDAECRSTAMGESTCKRIQASAPAWTISSANTTRIDHSRVSGRQHCCQQEGLNRHLPFSAGAYLAPRRP